MNSAYIIDFNFVSCVADCHIMAQLHRLHHEITDSMRELTTIHKNPMFAKSGRRVVIRVCTDNKAKHAYLFEPTTVTSSHFDKDWNLITENNVDWDLHGTHCAIGFLNTLRRQLGMWLEDVKAGSAYEGNDVNDEDAMVCLDLLTNGHYNKWYQDKLTMLMSQVPLALA